ncbi:MAG: GLPGLI family protein [Crocinitomicaceae bacterium]|jgi:GLPGLI family protein|tara:strand:+ start:1275 stop:2015 length:741 start_codon:yes stop_codon:yes gene_type:complete
MTLKVGIKSIGTIVFFVTFCGSSLFGQYHSSGKITFERKTNLLKRYNDARMKRFVTEENKIKIDKFELLFNDTSSVFRPILEVEEGRMGWMTTKNYYYQYLQENTQFTILGLFGQNVYVKDSLPTRSWKITNSKRNIGGYECRKAIYEKNDSTRIYAWYASELTTSIGPEGYCGLPGVILGLATEDGGIVYFAKKIEFVNPTEEELRPDFGKNDVFTLEQLKVKIEKDYGNTPWGKKMFDDLFRWL